MKKLALALVVLLATPAFADITRQVDGFVVDSSRPNVRTPATIVIGQNYGSTNGVVTAAANAAGVSVAEYGVGPFHQTVFTFTAVSMTSTDSGGANGAQGSLQIYDFPQCVTTFLGASESMTTLAGSGGIADGAAVVFSVGTVTAAADVTLTSTEADIVPSYAGTLTAGAGVVKGVSTTSQLVQFNGTQTAKDAYFNFAVPDADSSANDTLTVDGTITITWLCSGDN